MLIFTGYVWSGSTILAAFSQHEEGLANEKAFSSKLGHIFDGEKIARNRWSVKMKVLPSKPHMYAGMRPWYGGCVYICRRTDVCQCVPWGSSSVRQGAKTSNHIALFTLGSNLAEEWIWSGGLSQRSTELNETDSEVISENPLRVNKMLSVEYIWKRGREKRKQVAAGKLWPLLRPLSQYTHS